MRPLPVIAAFLAVTASLTHAAALTNAASADTYIEGYGNESKNYGSSPELRIDQWGGRQVLLRFPIENLPNEAVISATVRLFITDIGFHEA